MPGNSNTSTLQPQPEGKINAASGFIVMNGTSMPTNGSTSAAMGNGGGGAMSMMGGQHTGNPLQHYQQQLQASQATLGQHPTYPQGKVWWRNTPTSFLPSPPLSTF